MAGSSINTQLVTYVVPWEGHRQPGQKTAGHNKEAGRRKGGTKTSKKKQAATQTKKTREDRIQKTEYKRAGQTKRSLDNCVL